MRRISTISSGSHRSNRSGPLTALHARLSVGSDGGWRTDMVKRDVSPAVCVTAELNAIDESPERVRPGPRSANDSSYECEKYEGSEPWLSSASRRTARRKRDMMIAVILRGVSAVSVWRAG